MTSSFDNDLTICQFRLILNGASVSADCDMKNCLALLAPYVKRLVCECLSCKPRKKKTKLALAPTWAQDCAQLLSDKLDVNYKEQWARDIEKLRVRIGELNRVTEGECQNHVEACIHWLFSDQNEGKYAFVVASGSALLDKWPRIVSAAKRIHQVETPNREYDEWLNG